MDRIVERRERGYEYLRNIVFVAVVLGAGAAIWNQQNEIGDLKTAVAVLKLECAKNAPTERGEAYGKSNGH